MSPQEQAFKAVCAHFGLSKEAEESIMPNLFQTNKTNRALDKATDHNKLKPGIKGPTGL